jgi:hypothetical protein
MGKSLFVKGACNRALAGITFFRKVIRKMFKTEKIYEADARCAIMVRRNTRSAITHDINIIRLTS